VTYLRFLALVWLPLLLNTRALAQNGALRILEPVPSKDGTVMTSEPAIRLKGTFAWTGGDMRVQWKNFRGFSDLASVVVSADRHLVEWNTTTPIPLRPGVNHVRIQALGQPGAAGFVNIFYTPREIPPPTQLATIWLHNREITYESIHGRAVYQSDMILGDAAEVARGHFAGRLAGGGMRLRPQSATITPNSLVSNGLWPVVSGVVRVPYTIDPSNAPPTVTNIDSALAESNTQLTGVVHWTPATGSDDNFVNFIFDSNDQSGACEAIVGMQGQGSQPISGAGNCTVNTILHEMGHALGLYHEQSRSDRDTYVTYSEANVDKPEASNFDKLQSEANSGLYNYASIMEYSPFLFSRNGITPVLETIPAGMVLGSDLPQYTTGDLDGIKRLYGFATVAVTVDTNPTGLQVVVDNVTCKAPCVFSNWTIGSQHALSVPLDSHSQTLQTLSQQPYIFGRWNAGSNGQQSVTITNSAGSGSLLSPATAPAITNYLASFITVHPYSPAVSPSGKGTISASPTPGTLIINGTSTSYFTDREYVTLTVTPNNGYTFYEWAYVPLYNLYTRVYSFYITSNFDYWNFDTADPVTAQLVTNPVLTITASSADIGSAGIFPGFAIGVIETSTGATTFGNTPQNFYGPGFTPGAQLTLCATGLNGTTCPTTPVAQSPATTNITYAFNGWNGYTSNSSNAISFTMPSSSQTINAEFTPSFRVIVLPSPYCTGGGLSVNTSPTVTSSNPNGGLDAFFSVGLTTFVASPGTGGLVFSDWTGDLGGASDPYEQTLAGELIATANFNVAGTTQPLTITSVSPATPVINTATNLIVTGTGFTTNSTLTTAYVGPAGGTLNGYTTTLQSSTQMTIPVPSNVFTVPGYYQVLVQNSSGGCGPEAAFTFPVATAPPPTLTTISVTAPRLSIAKGLTDPFTATGTYSDNSTQDLTSQVAWASQTQADVTISTAGVATGVAIGSSKITATLGSVSGNATLTVTAAALVSIAVTPANTSIPVGGTQQFTATGTYTDTTTQNLTSSVSWGSTNTGAATIVNGGANAGKASGVGAGSSTIGASTGTSPVISDSTTLTVTSTSFSPCDVNQDGHYTVLDVQAIVNQALGTAQAVSDLNTDHAVNVVDVQIVINAALNLGCTL